MYWANALAPPTEALLSNLILGDNPEEHALAPPSGRATVPTSKCRFTFLSAPPGGQTLLRFSSDLPAAPMSGSAAFA